MTEPVLTQTLTMHLNGGSKFSALNFDILADGKPTEIKRYNRTDGSPKYLITDDIFVCGEDEFDMLETKGVGLKEWVLAHISSPATKETQ